MASWTFYLITSVVALVLYLFLKRDNRKVPKGPWAWPVVGNGPQLKPSVHEALAKWARKYGDIYTVYFGRDRAIVLSDPKLVREAFNDMVFSGRPNLETFTLLRGGKHGVVASDGQEWMEQRRFTVRHLRDFGFGKNTGEELITNEVKEFIQGLDKNVGKPVSINKSFSVATLNTLWMIMSGVRYDQDDPRLWSILSYSNKLIKKMGENPLLLVAPHLAKLAPKLSGYNVLLEVVQNFRQLVLEHVDGHRKEYTQDEIPKDFIDVYLKEIIDTTDPSSSFYKDAGIKSLISVVIDLFIAGADTTSTTLSWLILYLAKFPDIQEKLQEELDGVVGRSRNPCLADRPHMPYTEAVIAESMRMSSIVPTALFHTTMNDVHFHGYEIPKDTIVLPNLHFIHHDKRIWGNPEEFQPERFLSADGKTFKKHDALMPFGFGKRQCLAEPLARDSVFLYFTNIFHRYNIRLADESVDASLEPANEFVLAPQDFKIVLQERV